LTDPIDWLLSLERLGMKFGLENMTRLIAELDHPEQRFLSAHIAGTNGKGSVTAMLEEALRRAGHRSARYTSPHLERLEERFVVTGAPVATGALSAAVAAVRDAVLRLQDESPGFSPTFFECATAAAFVVFRSERVEIAVIETGLGGRLDATNVVNPVATAITSVDFDHQALLGGTLSSIAREKAGIIKPGIPVVLGPLPAEAESEILRVAAERRAPVVRGRELTGITPALRGRHQRDNIAVTASLADVLNGRGLEIPESALRDAIENVHWPARLERFVDGKHEFLLDAAHNPAGARALADYLRESSWTDAALVFGAMADKDAGGMLRELAPVTTAIVCTTAEGGRAAGAEDLAGIARSFDAVTSVHVEPDPIRAVDLARTLSRHIVIAGSMFLVGPLRGILR
jgi:dihydrofolate synthase/folylpolyglutamate synthase